MLTDSYLLFYDIFLSCIWSFLPLLWNWDSSENVDSVIMTHSGSYLICDPVQNKNVEPVQKNIKNSKILMAEH